MKRLLALLIVGLSCSAMNIQEGDQEEGSSLLEHSSISVSTFPELGQQLCNSRTRYIMGILVPAFITTSAISGALCTFTVAECTNPETQEACENDQAANLATTAGFVGLASCCGAGILAELIRAIRGSSATEKDLTYFTERSFNDEQDIEITQTRLTHLLNFQEKLEASKTEEEEDAINQLKLATLVQKQEVETVSVHKKDLAYLVQAIRAGTRDDRFYAGDNPSNCHLTVKLADNEDYTIGGPALQAWLEAYKTENNAIELKLKHGCIIHRLYESGESYA